MNSYFPKKHKPDCLRFCIACFFVSFFLCSCKEDKRMQNIQQIVAEWTGREIRFPAGIPCQSLGRDTVCINTSSPNYKILLYVDSTGCTGCRLKLSEWKQLMAEADTLFPAQIDFLIFYQPKDKDRKELEFQMKLYDFRHPVFMDIENQIDQANRFPAHPDLQCFLLDRDNKVVVIGNPAINPKIWELYKQQISGLKRSAVPLTTIQVTPARLELYGMKIGGTYTAVFEIENTGDKPYVILGITSSCGCTVPTWSKQPVAPEGKTEIKVEVKPESTGFFNKTIEMKRFSLEVITIVVFAVIAVFCVNVKSDFYSLSELGLSNVEALADEKPKCSDGCLSDGDGCWCKIYCMDWKETSVK